MQPPGVGTERGVHARFGIKNDQNPEWAYDRKSPFGTLDKAWEEAIAKGWIVPSMKDDWKTIFPPAGTTAITQRHRIVTITGL